MKKKIPYIILGIYLTAACVGVTFAWMSAPSTSKIGTQAVFEFNEESGYSLSTRAKDLTFKAYALDSETSSYIPTSEFTAFMEVVPNSVLRFRCDLTNKSDKTMSCSLQLVDLSASDESFFSYVYCGITAAEGYDSRYSYKDPTGLVKTLSGYTTYGDIKTLTFIDDLDVVPTEEGEMISLYGYFKISHKLGNEFQEQEIDVGKFRVILK